MILLKYREVYEGLAKVGFKTNLGPHGGGIIQLLYANGGGYYIGKFLDCDAYHVTHHLW